MSNNSAGWESDNGHAVLPAAPPPGLLPPPLLGARASDAPHPFKPTANELFAESVRRLLTDDGTAVALVALDGTIRDLSTPMLNLIGARSSHEVTPGSPAEGVLRSFLDHVPSELFRSGKNVWHGKVDHRALDGSPLLLRATASASRTDAHGGDVAIMLHDITEASQQMAKLVHRATHDPLTGLANRQQLLQQLAEAIGKQRDQPGHVAAVFLDLDRLKYVNDVFGHAAGDRFLVSTARRLSKAVRPADAIARIGGDEFLFVATGVNDAVSAIGLADRAQRALSGHLQIGELDLEVSVSVGIALTDTDVMNLDDDDAASMLISNADTAMYQSKQNGRKCSTLFTSQMRSKARRRIEMAGELSHAITAGEIDVEYQAIFSAVTRKPLGAEALVRWRHPTLGLVDASTVIAVAEESGSIGRLGEFVLERSMADLAKWRAEGLVDNTFAIHVNVSRVQLASASFVKSLTERLTYRQLEPAQLVLEARESPLLGSETEVVRSIRALRQFGVQIAIDNFGTGAKALAVLTDVGADVLKLDGSLTLPAGSSEADVRLVRAVVLLAHALEMVVVAERVSGLEQLQRLRAAGCDMLQGNLLALPSPGNTVTMTADQTW
ncbi:MAG: diguanylate cyclase (GGDEF)-like protein [Ilumatobacter sp.]|jgi:diguanylate cyclase (GGDEF)-like protein